MIPMRPTVDSSLLLLSSWLSNRRQGCSTWSLRPLQGTPIQQAYLPLSRHRSRRGSKSRWRAPIARVRASAATKRVHANVASSTDSPRRASTACARSVRKVSSAVPINVKTELAVEMVRPVKEVAKHQPQFRRRRLVMLCLLRVIRHFRMSTRRWGTSLPHRTVNRTPREHLLRHPLIHSIQPTLSTHIHILDTPGRRRCPTHPCFQCLSPLLQTVLPKLTRRRRLLRRQMVRRPRKTPRARSALGAKAAVMRAQEMSRRTRRLSRMHNSRTSRVLLQLPWRRWRRTSSPSLSRRFSHSCPLRRTHLSPPSVEDRSPALLWPPCDIRRLIRATLTTWPDDLSCVRSQMDRPLSSCSDMVRFVLEMYCNELPIVRPCSLPVWSISFTCSVSFPFSVFNPACACARR